MRRTSNLRRGTTFMARSWGGVRKKRESTGRQQEKKGGGEGRRGEEKQRRRRRKVKEDAQLTSWNSSFAAYGIVILMTFLDEWQ